jgi:hypothetical protein
MLSKMTCSPATHPAAAELEVGERGCTCLAEHSLHRRNKDKTSKAVPAGIKHTCRCARLVPEALCILSTHPHGGRLSTTAANAGHVEHLEVGGAVPRGVQTFRGPHRDGVLRGPRRRDRPFAAALSRPPDVAVVAGGEQRQEVLHSNRESERQAEAGQLAMQQTAACVHA